MRGLMKGWISFYPDQYPTMQTQRKHICTQGLTIAARYSPKASERTPLTNTSRLDKHHHQEAQTAYCTCNEQTEDWLISSRALLLVAVRHCRVLFMQAVPGLSPRRCCRNRGTRFLKYADVLVAVIRVTIFTRNHISTDLMYRRVQALAVSKVRISAPYSANARTGSPSSES